MSELKICAINHSPGGPSIPSDHGAWLGRGDWDVPILHLQLGDMHIEVWPADAEKIHALGEKLIKIAKELSEGKKGGGQHSTEA